MTPLRATAQNLYRYQKERFPIFILGLSFLPAILSSGAVVTRTGSIHFTFVILALVISLTYLLHVRIIDEFRDYDHDVRHHNDRPVPRGIVTLGELRIVNWVVIVLVIGSAAYAGSQTFAMATVMLLYSFLARNEFFLGMWLRKHFFVYNAVNLVQMLLLQVLVYTLADETFHFTSLILVHFLFTASGTIIFEFLRKVKTPGQDGTGQDTYTWFLGHNTALRIYAVCAILNILLFIKVLSVGQSAISYWAPVTLLLAAGTYISLLIHGFRKEERTNQLLQVSFMAMYGIFNILIFLSM